MRTQQKATLFDPENRWECWETKYLTSDWWQEIDVNRLMKHIFFLHKAFLCAVGPKVVGPRSFFVTMTLLSLSCPGLKDVPLRSRLLMS